MATTKTKAQATYERIEKLKGSSTSMADAVRQVAREQSKKEGAVRANYYNHARKLTGGSKRRSRRSTRADLSVEDAVARAKDELRKAITGIDREVDAAKKEFDAAKARYDELVGSTDRRKKQLKRKIAALGK